MNKLIFVPIVVLHFARAENENGLFQTNDENEPDALIPSSAVEIVEKVQNGFSNDEIEAEWVSLDPPRNLRVKTSMEDMSNPVASFFWDPPEEVKRVTGYKVSLSLIPAPEELEVEDFHDSRKTQTLSSSASFLVGAETLSFTTDKVFSLQPGTGYLASVQTEFHSRLSAAIETNFTLKPNPPDRFVVWYRNETSLLILWQPPKIGGFHSYKASISPKEGDEESSFQVFHLTRWEYQFGGIRPGFHSLRPGKAYNISVHTEAYGQESFPVTKEYRTMPLPVKNVRIMSVNVEIPQVIVEWDPPSELDGDFDGFTILLKRDWEKMTPAVFIQKGNGSSASLPVTLTPGEEYEVTVKTVSGRHTSSHPVTTKFTHSSGPSRFSR